MHTTDFESRGGQRGGTGGRDTSRIFQLVLLGAVAFVASTPAEKDDVRSKRGPSKEKGGSPANSEGRFNDPIRLPLFLEGEDAEEDAVDRRLGEV
mmetsp:Transcript_18783/g.27181  ORF Transcript_18783/g.27181 Transcript_18783/m.27181 type:complete len:95 (-) Transcript_18783:98-382(-)